MKRTWLGMLALLMAFALLTGAVAESDFVAAEADDEEAYVTDEAQEVTAEQVEADVGVGDEIDYIEYGYDDGDDMQLDELPDENGEYRLDTYEMQCDDMEADAAADDNALMEGNYSEVGLDAEYHSAAEIQAYVNAHPSSRNSPTFFRRGLKKNPYSPPLMTEFTLNSALTMLNQVRYIAGLEPDIELDWSLEEQEAAACLVCSLAGMSHNPPRPEALADPMYDDLYNMGYKGASSSNLSSGGNITDNVLGWVSDRQNVIANNIGHRLWILSNKMKKTMFGKCGISAFAAFDGSRVSALRKIAWPAQEMPTQYYNVGDMWSVTFDQSTDASQIQVSLVRRSDGRTWLFSQQASNGYFGFGQSGYGGYHKGSVMFRPDGLNKVSNGDIFDVAITDGANARVIRYSVHFFDLDLSALKALSDLDCAYISAAKFDDGNHMIWKEVPGAEGYFIVRSDDQCGDEVIADVPAGTNAYVDVNVSPDRTYTYSVYAHNSFMASNDFDWDIADKMPMTMRFTNVGESVNMKVNASLKLLLQTEPSDAQADLYWYSSNRSVATVSQKGVVKARKKGTATITVAADKVRAKVKVVVGGGASKSKKVKRVTLNVKGSVPVKLGETLQLTATIRPAGATGKIKWKSSNRKVARVDGNGLVTPVRAGKATITAKVGKKSAKVKVRVVDPNAPSSVSILQGRSATVEAGETLQLTAALAPVTAVSALRWRSSKKTVAVVDANGLVTAKKKGKARITVITGNGKKATIKIKVVE